MPATKQIAEAAATSAGTAASRTETATAMIIAIAQRHAAGTRLGTKETLRTECGVSVGTFNEALALAQARGYVTMKPGPGGGIFVDEQSAIARLGNAMLALDTAEPSVPDAIRIRDALDPLLIDDAVTSAQHADIAGMRGQLERMRAALDAGEHLEFARANWALHRVIAEASPSQMLRSVYLGVLGLLEDHAVSIAGSADAPLPEYVRSRYDLHVEIVDAIAARDGERARELIALHNLNG
ncbi:MULTISPECIES: FadR/GntR family transcriptional regulator [unclassified Brevibacterium]|uniref:FadR/GntR family transcriptional regulator n=1 Tax=unclassified Brevibacterium TaxID=2614124 RepID=UPI001BA8BDCA|nr:FCD domain-containing protein [Brevibacterium sp. W7.2]